MASITLRNLDDPLKNRLHLQAMRHGHSMENEAREILRPPLSTDKPRNQKRLVESIQEKVAHTGGADIDLPPREIIADRVIFD